MALPSGTVTFLFTDIEGSTRLWDGAPEAMRAALHHHDAIVRTAIEAHGGYVFSTGGDGFAVAFTRAGDAVRTALEAQAALAAQRWPDGIAIAVRMGVHTGEVEERGGDFFGPAVNRAARIMAAGHGGQVLVGATTASLVRGSLPGDAGLADLGVHRLKDLAEAESVFQLTHPSLRDAFPPLRTIDAVPGNLPTLRSSFVGRSADLRRLEELFGSHRLITLTGVGGVGKTRFALQAAANAAGRYPGGVWLIELARTGDPAAVVTVAAVALGVTSSQGRSVVEALCDHLRSTRSLVVVDNCEHVLDAAADLVSEILDRCPAVTLVCTSREPLDVDGEQIVPVRPLDPAGDAMVLFAERVRAGDPELVVAGVEEAAAAEICRRLDGVPLALELAAAQASTMALADIARGLDDRFRLLASGRRRAVERHQTLRTTVEWSHQLLGEPEQRLLRRLGVFAGGFTADAVRAVAVRSDEQLEVEVVLGSLVRRSMVQLDRTPTGARYRLLETIRTYAQERLADANESETFGRAHAEWVASLVDREFDAWWVPGAGLWRMMHAERDNWREAVGFALANRDPPLAVALLTHAGCTDLSEASAYCLSALELDGVENVPGWHWLHHTIAARGASEVNLALLRHIEQFEAACATDVERARAVWWRAVLTSIDGSGSPVDDIERGLATPGLSVGFSAMLEALRAFWINISGATDVEAARRAVRAASNVGGLMLAYATAVLALALRATDPDGALEAMRTVVELTDNDDQPDLSGASVALALSAVTAIAVDRAATYLRDHLHTISKADRTVEETYLAVCANVLGRAGHPAAAVVRSYVLGRPVDPWIEVFLPDLPDIAAPAHLDELIDITRTALTDVCGPIENVMRR